MSQQKEVMIMKLCNNYGMTQSLGFHMIKAGICPG